MQPLIYLIHKIIDSIRCFRNLDTSVPSLHSSGRDSGLDLSRERSESPSKQIVRIMADSQVRGRIGSKRKKCTCSHAEQHRCSGDDSRLIKTIFVSRKKSSLNLAFDSFLI